MKGLVQPTKGGIALAQDHSLEQGVALDGKVLIAQDAGEVATKSGQESRPRRGGRGQRKNSRTTLDGQSAELAAESLVTLPIEFAGIVGSPITAQPAEQFELLSGQVRSEGLLDADSENSAGSDPSLAGVYLADPNGEIEAGVAGPRFV